MRMEIYLNTSQRQRQLRKTVGDESRLIKDKLILKFRNLERFKTLYNTISLNFLLSSLKLGNLKSIFYILLYLVIFKQEILKSSVFHSFLLQFTSFPCFLLILKGFQSFISLDSPFFLNIEIFFQFSESFMIS